MPFLKIFYSHIRLLQGSTTRLFENSIVNDKSNRIDFKPIYDALTAYKKYDGKIVVFLLLCRDSHAILVAITYGLLSVFIYGLLSGIGVTFSAFPFDNSVHSIRHIRKSIGQIRPTHNTCSTGLLLLVVSFFNSTSFFCRTMSGYRVLIFSINTCIIMFDFFVNSLLTFLTRGLDLFVNSY